MGISFSIEGLESPAEVAVAWHAVEQYRQSHGKSRNEPSEGVTPQIDATTAAVADRILKGLNWGPLGPRYRAMLQVWLDAPEGQAVTVKRLAEAIGATRVELKANLSKLSARMKRIATTEEAASLRTPFLLLADIEYDETNSSRHRLTPAGREAVRRYLKA